MTTSRSKGDNVFNIDKYRQHTDDPFPKEGTIVEVAPEWLIYRLFGLDPENCELKAIRFEGETLELKVVGSAVPLADRCRVIIENVETLDGPRPVLVAFEPMESKNEGRNRPHR